jgi:hypothetical protein
MSEPEQDPLIEALLPDPAAGPAEVAVLTGYLGKSPSPNHQRLYLSRSLDRYVDIPVDQILHTTPRRDDDGTRVWVPRNLILNYVRTVSARVQAAFLQGSIMRTYRPATGPEVARAAAFARQRRLTIGICTDIDETIWCPDDPTMHDWGGCATPDCPM